MELGPETENTVERPEQESAGVEASYVSRDRG